MRVSRIINFLVSTRIQTLTGRPSGRAVLPLLGQVSCAERSGQARIRLRLGSGVSFVSDFYAEQQVRSVLERVRLEVPVFRVESVETELSPPFLYDVWRLQRDGCRVLGARAIEVASQLEQLYHGGYVARDHTVSEQYVASARAELAAFGDAAGEVPELLTGTVPTNLRCLPSDVPKPVRQVYRLIWANTLCAFGQPMRVQRETACFTIDGVRFRAESIVPLSAGFDHVGFGLFYRRGHIGQSRAVEEARMFGSGPFEHELLDTLQLRLSNPALALKAAENIGYIGFDGPEVTVLELGAAVLDTVRKQVPQLLDAGLFDAVERHLDVDGRDPQELLESWSRWAESVTRAVKRRSVAYLR
jgi:DNA topoisomerase IA